MLCSQSSNIQVLRHVQMRQADDGIDADGFEMLDYPFSDTQIVAVDRYVVTVIAPMVGMCGERKNPDRLAFML